MGLAACFSFYPSKNLGGAGDGGMLTTDDAELADRLRVLRGHGAKKKYFHEVVGMNSRLDSLQAAILRVKLRHLDEWAAARRENAARYRALFSRSGLLDNGTVKLPVEGVGRNRGMSLDRGRAGNKNQRGVREIDHTRPRKRRRTGPMLGRVKVSRHLLRIFDQAARRRPGHEDGGERAAAAAHP